jgi:glycosyltransferase involved in cell wall biosynthesis
VPAARVYLAVNAFVPVLAPLTRARARAELGLAPEGTYAGWVGRLAREKGADVMLQALAHLAPEVRLCIIGDGAERAALERLAERLRIRERVRWHGVVPDAARVLGAFDVVVVSSRREGTPIVLLEAMAAGTPVVTTRVGGIPDVVSPAEAMLVDADDPRGLAAAVAATLSDAAAAARRADAARVRLAHDFAVEPWLDRIDTVYDAAVRRVGGSAR